MSKMNVTVEAGIAYLPDGSVVDLLFIQSVLNNAFQESGHAECASASNDLSLITQHWQGPHGDFLPGSYRDNA